MRFAGLIIAWCILVTPAWSRPVAGHSPQELSGRSDLICNGRVLEVKKTAEKGEVVLSGNAGLAVEFWTARIKVLAAFKGSAPAEIELRYPELDPIKVPMVVNGPEQIYLAKDKRYLFYLKSTKEPGKYVGCLDGDFDDGGAVEVLIENTPDNLPPLDRDTALALADACVKKDASFRGRVPAGDGYYAAWGRPSWMFNYYDGPPLNYPAFSHAAEIIVQSDRTIGLASWIGTEFPRRGSEIATKDVGRFVRLTRDTGHGEIEVLRGTVEKVDADAVTMRCGEGNPNWHPGDKVVVERKEITSFQVGHGPQ